MPLASEFINKAYSLIGVKPAGVSLTTDEIATGIESLNDMLSEWTATGINIGYTKVSAATGETSLPDWAVRAVKYELAAALAPEFGRVLSPAFADIGTLAKAAVIQKTTEVPEMGFPGTLPKGAGNTSSHYDGSSPFFTDESSGDLVSNGDGVLLTDEGKDLGAEIPE